MQSKINGSTQTVILNEFTPSPFLVGITIQFELKSVAIKKKRIQATVLGWSNQDFLMVQLFDIDPELYAMPPETEIVGRYVLQGKVIGFISRMKFKQTKPIHMWFVAFPIQLEVLNLRRNIRIPMIVEAKSPEGEVFITKDISKSGASLIYKPQPEKKERNIGEEILLSFMLPDQAQIQNLKIIVVRKSIDKDQIFLGVRFSHENNPELAKLVASLEKVEALYAPVFGQLN